MDWIKEGMSIFVGLSILLGLVECFYGYRVFKQLMVLVGFIIGALLFGAIGYELFGEHWLVLLLGLVGGIVTMVLTLFFYFPA